MDVEPEREVEHHQVDEGGTETEALVLDEELMGHGIVLDEQTDGLPDDTADQYTEKEGQGQEAYASA